VVDVPPVLVVVDAPPLLVVVDAPPVLVVVDAPPLLVVVDAPPVLSVLPPLLVELLEVPPVVPDSEVSSPESLLQADTRPNRATSPE